MELANRFEKLSDKLVELSVSQHVNAFSDIVWPEKISEDQYWFSPDALSVAHTDEANALSQEELIKLSKWECINSFSLNTTGERELIYSVTKIMDEMPLGTTKEYLYHLINEENQHMWYFQKFCQLYGQKVYPSKNIPVVETKMSKQMDHFLTFARIVLFEEIGHYYNIVNSKDERVHPFIRQINQSHYNDEARHITFGRSILTELGQHALTTDEDIEFATQQLSKTLIVNYRGLYNPSMYRDAGIAKPLEIRERLMQHSARQKIYKVDVLNKINKAFNRLGIKLSYPGDA